MDILDGLEQTPLDEISFDDVIEEDVAKDGVGVCRDISVFCVKLSCYF